jgi:uncharacterized iron-regulated membrane protein
VGSIGGFVGKIIAFLVSLVCASLPVTGFIIWWKRKKTNKKILRSTKNTRPRLTKKELNVSCSTVADEA